MVVFVSGLRRSKGIGYSSSAIAFIYLGNKSWVTTPYHLGIKSW